VPPILHFSPVLRAGHGGPLGYVDRRAPLTKVNWHDTTLGYPGVPDSNRPVFPKYFFGSSSRGAGLSATSMNPQVRCMSTIGNDGNLSQFRAL
jgi:hypothetical protein